jgi:hypothetical protein
MEDRRRASQEMEGDGLASWRTEETEATGTESVV